jgi:hypothetical protein
MTRLSYGSSARLSSTTVVRYTRFDSTPDRRVLHFGIIYPVSAVAIDTPMCRTFQDNKTNSNRTVTIFASIFEHFINSFFDNHEECGMASRQNDR